MFPAPRKFFFALLVATTALLIVVPAFSQHGSIQPAALPYPSAATPAARDLGPLKAQSGTNPISVTIALRLPNVNEAESLLKSINTPGDPQFHKFLTSEQFVARFAPTNADVAKVIAALAKYGLTAERTTATNLRVTGLPANMERAFAVSLHSYNVPAQGNVPSYTFHAPLTRATIPAEIAPAVAAVVGLDSRPSLRPHHLVAPQTVRRARSSAPSTSSGNDPGFWTVSDFANYYDVAPLYSDGVSGKGRTIGIMTFASFTPSDAFAYWSALGLTVGKGRVQIVNVDGGPGKPSDSSGSDETTLDVEQSGGIAPSAKIIVYQAPNTNQGSVDIFAAAVEANLADSLSISWGFWEWYQNLENSPVIDPITGQTVGITDATHELLLRAAIQGQTVFAAAGDGGAYDINNDFGCTTPTCSNTLTVDYPASDTAITGAGGTTLAGTQSYCLNAQCTPPYYNIKIPNERVWGWNYLEGLCKKLGYDPISCGIFPGGGGGGVSILFDKPIYQFYIPGVQRSQANQNWEINGQLVYGLPSGFAGRNVPDVSFNADPDTGYEIYYTSSQSGFGIDTFWGGTSFVAPQLNGVTALLGQYLGGHRIGLLNYPLYSLVQSGQAYTGSTAPLHAVPYGNNWFYHGRNGYSPADGVGTLDVANFAAILRSEY